MRLAGLVKIAALTVVLYQVPSFAEMGFDADEVPAGARERAVRQLEEWWKPLALSHPAFVGLDQQDVNISSAKLGTPFVLHVLREEDFSAYATSPDVDPTMFARIHWYWFPIYADEKFLGSLSTCRNVDPDGGKINDNDAEFTTGGAVLQEDVITREVEALRKKFRGYRVSVIMARGSTFGTVCMLTDSTGQRYVANALDLTSLQKAIPELKTLNPNLVPPQR